MSSQPIDIIGKHYLLDYGSGMYPFVFFQYERTSRFLLETRGVSNVARCWQDSIKVEMDSRIDAASMATLPPITHPPGRPPTLWGPGQLIETRRPGEYNYAPPPPPPQGSVEVQNRLETMANRYFGRDIGPDYQVEGNLKVQNRLNRWLEGWGKVIKMVWGLYQQFGDDTAFFRVSGQPTSKPIQFQKGSPTDQYDIYISYNYENSDPEAFLNKLEKAVQLAGQLDRNGMVEWNKLLIAAFQSIDITFVDDFLQPADSAANKEVNDAQLTYAKAAAGFDVDVPPTASTQIWQQVLQQYTQGSPNIPASDVQARYQSDPAFRARIDKLAKQLQFKQEQMQNAQIGRIGTPPAPGPAPQLPAAPSQ